MRLLAVIMIATMFPGFVADASAQSVEDFYRGKSIDVVIGFGAGGGNDTYARLLANHLGKHIPGRPHLIAKNMPGAGSFLAVNHVFNIAPRDGTVIALGAPTMALDEKIGSEGVRFKSSGLNWIGRIDSQIDVLFMTKGSSVKTIDDARRIEATLSSTGAGSASSNYPTVLNNVVGTKFKIILGYRGSNDAMLAVERGEAEGHSTAWNTLKVARPDWIMGRSINLLVQFALNRHPELADVPTAIELGRTDEDRQVLTAIMSASEIGTAFFTTPGVPPERLTALRRAFDATMKDPAFLADAERAKFSVGAITGEEVQKLVADVDGLPTTLVQKIRAAFVLPNTK